MICYSIFFLLQVIDYYTGTPLDQRWIIGGFLVPLILLSWVPNLKKLAPVSMVANLFMGVSLGITFYYLVWDLPPISEVPKVSSISNFPVFFSLTIFAMEAIGVVSLSPFSLCFWHRLSVKFLVSMLLENDVRQISTKFCIKF